MMYQYQNWNSDQNYNFDQMIMVCEDPGGNSSYYWAAQYSLSGVSKMGGHMGLQTDLIDNNNNNLGKGAIFSLWGATQASPNPTLPIIVHPNTDGDQGMSLLMPYNWKAGVAYRFRIWIGETDDGGVWWTYSVMDSSTGEETSFGRLYFPNKAVRIAGQTIVWSEYYGGGDCSAHKPASVIFFNPKMRDYDHGGDQLDPSSVSLDQNSPCKVDNSQPKFCCFQQVLPNQ